MRPKIIAANWKMHKSRVEARTFITELAPRVTNLPGHVRLVIFPPFTAIESTISALVASPIRNCVVGAQNIHSETHGAYTGEVSASMLIDLGVKAVLVGHSERRALFGEKDDFLLKKVQRCLQEGLTPMLCVGETLEQRDAGITRKVLGEQISAVFSALNAEQAAMVQLAYEPVWAIGTGRTATPEQAQEAHAWIRENISNLHGATAQSIPILYGGSVKPENASQILCQHDVDGALIGGASLQADSFAAIALACNKI